MSQSRIYLDHAATTPLLPEARAAIAEALGRWHNPSSAHAEGMAARGSSKVPVLVSQKRHVRKPRKAPVGTVTVSRYETVMVEPRCPDEGEKS